MTALKKVGSWLKGLFQGNKLVSMVSDTDIDQIESATINLINLIKKIIELKNDDGKLSSSDWLRIGKDAISLVNNARKWKELKGEILDFNVGKGKLLAQSLTNAGVLPQKIDIVVVNAIEAIEGMVSIYNRNVMAIVNALKKN